MILNNRKQRRQVLAALKRVRSNVLAGQGDALYAVRKICFSTKKELWSLSDWRREECPYIFLRVLWADRFDGLLTAYPIRDGSGWTAERMDLLNHIIRRLTPYTR